MDDVEAMERGVIGAGLKRRTDGDAEAMGEDGVEESGEAVVEADSCGMDDGTDDDSGDEVLRTNSGDGIMTE